MLVSQDQTSRLIQYKGPSTKGYLDGKIMGLRAAIYLS